MKIGIDASRYKHAESTGVEWYSWHIINGLVKEVSINGEDELILYSKEKLDLPANIKNCVSNKVLPGLRLWTIKILSGEMKKNPPDVLFVPSHTFPLNLPKKCVITIHDVAFQHLPKVYSFIQYHYLKLSTMFAVKKATKIITPSEATKNDLVKYFQCPSEKIVVIPHGFSAPEKVTNEAMVIKNSVVFQYFGITKSSPYILFIGRLEMKKNLVKLVEAFNEFSQKNQDYRLVLAGKRGVGFEKILRIVKKLGLAHKVVMSGYITEEEKFVLYKYAKVFAFPSLYEGFGLPILEAFYHEKPVLCSNTSSLPEVGGEAVHYVDPKSVKEIAAALEKLVNDEKYSHSLVEKGRARLKLFSWEIATKKTLWTIKE